MAELTGPCTSKQAVTARGMFSS